MANHITFSAQPRTLLGKKSGQLRRKGQVPANISGNVKESVAVTLDKSKFAKLYTQVGDTGLIYLTVDGQTGERPVLVSEVQVDSLTNEPLHVVFRQVNLSEKITAEVPVEFVGEFTVKDAVLVHVHDAIEVKALPTDLPEKFEIDISALTEIGQAFTFSQLKFDRSKVELMIEEEELESPIVLVQEVKEEVVEEVVAAPAEGEVAPAAGVEGAPADAAASDAKAAPAKAAAPEKK